MEPIGDGKYKCAKCGYVYDPEKGDPKHGIAPVTRLEDLLADWKCPRCRSGLDAFKPVYCSTHTPLGYENLEAKRVMDLDNPPETIWPDKSYFVLDEATGKYICYVCGYVYDPAEHDCVAFEDLPDDWKCPRCKRPKDKFNKT